MKKLLFLSFFSFVLSANTFFEIKEQTNDKIKINFNLQDYEVKNNQNGKNDQKSPKWPKITKMTKNNQNDQNEHKGKNNQNDRKSPE